MIKYIREKGPKKFEYNYDIEIENEEIIPKTWKNKIF